MPKPNSTIIRFENITKEFGPIKAVENLNLEIHEGEIIGLVGPNGAGKTTSIKMLANILRPTRGKILVKDDRGQLQDIATEPKNLLKSGFLIDIPSFYEGLTAYELLKYFAKLQKYPDGNLEERIDEILKMVELVEWKHQKVKIFSKGMKQKLGLAQAIIHDPDIIVLDEPQTGLDPKARILVREILKDLQSEAKTIFLSSHMLYEISEVCDKIAIIDEGKLMEFGSIPELEKKLRSQEIRCELLAPLELEHLSTSLKELEEKLSPYLENAEAYTDLGHHILYDPFERNLKIQYDGKPESQNLILETLIKETDLKIKAFFTPKTTLLEKIYTSMISKKDSIKDIDKY